MTRVENIVGEIMVHIQEEIDTWLVDNNLMLEFDTIYLEGLIEEVLEKALKEG
ncbi:MAG: hypothetical protein ACXAC2_00640 [Candidatus Kariarchaeaceae archaeon]